MSHKSQDPQLDFFSPLFDPLKALQCSGLSPPNPNVRHFDNISKAEFLLPYSKQRKDTERGSGVACRLLADDKRRVQIMKNKDLALHFKRKVAWAKADGMAAQTSISTRFSEASTRPFVGLARACRRGAVTEAVVRRAKGVVRVGGRLLWFDGDGSLLLDKSRSWVFVRGAAVVSVGEPPQRDFKVWGSGIPVGGRGGVEGDRGDTVLPSVATPSRRHYS